MVAGFGWLISRDKPNLNKNVYNEIKWIQMYLFIYESSLFTSGNIMTSCLDYLLFSPHR